MQKPKKVAKLVPLKRKMQKTKKVAKQVLLKQTQKLKKVAKQVPLKQMQKTKKVAKQVPPTQKPKKAAKKMLQNLKTTSQSPKKSQLKKQTLAKKSQLKKMLIVKKLKMQTLAKRQQPAKRQQLVPLRVPPLAHLAQALRHCVGISRIVKHLSKMTTKFVDYLALLWPILWGSLHDLKTYRKLNICVYFIFF